MNPPASAKPAVSPWLMVALAVTVHAASAGWHVLSGALNPDEGFYAVATRAVAHGEMPYRDFGFTQPPFVLYANCLPLRVLGFGLFEQRAVNGLWGALALAMAAVWVGRRTRPAWGLVLALGFSLSAPWMYFIHLGKTYAFTALLAVGAAWLFLESRRPVARAFGLGLLTALGLGTRLPAAPFFGVLWLLSLPPAGLRSLLAGIAGGAAGAGLLLPFLLADWESIRFWVLDFHRFSVPHKEWHLAWEEIATLAPALWLITAAAGPGVLRGGRWRTREAGVLLAAGAALAANLLPGGVYEEYGVPFLLPLAMAAAALVFDAVQSWNRIRLAAVLGLLVLTQFLTAPVLFRQVLPQRRGTASWWLPFNAPAYNPALPGQLAAARNLVAQTTAPDAPFIGPNLILAAETGRTVPPELRMGPFALTAELPAVQAARLHLATGASLDSWLARPDVSLVAFFNRRQLNYNWSMPGFGDLPESDRRRRLDLFRRDFVIAYQAGDFLLLVRKGLPPPAP